MLKGRLYLPHYLTLSQHIKTKIVVELHEVMSGDRLAGVYHNTRDLGKHFEIGQ